MALFETPQLDLEDAVVLEEIREARRELGTLLRTPRSWTGSLRRNAMARAILGSNSIEGYHIDLDDAVAAVEDESPKSADAATWVEIRGYRLALGYVLAAASDPQTRMAESMLKSLHYMMLSHDLSKSPGRYREREIFVEDEKSGRDRLHRAGRPAEPRTPAAASSGSVIRIPASFKPFVSRPSDSRKRRTSGRRKLEGGE